MLSDTFEFESKEKFTVLWIIPCHHTQVLLKYNPFEL